MPGLRRREGRWGQAPGLLGSLLPRVVVLDKVTDLLLFFGKLLVVGGVGVLGFFFFSGRIEISDPQFRSPSLNYYWLPILVRAPRRGERGWGAGIGAPGGVSLGGRDLG